LQDSDLEFPTQVLLIGILLVLIGSMLLRVGAILWRKRTQVSQLYPRSWTADQCQLMDRFCFAVGMTLSTLWLAQLIATPQMPTNSSFGFVEMVSIMALLLLTNAWLILVLPRDWNLLGALTERFLVTLMTLAVWWTLMFSGTAWLLAKASSVPQPRLMFGPVVASAYVPIWASVDADRDA
jgi:hypothetical protein